MALNSRDTYSEYEREYKKLNKEQKEAVETLSGPVMVVAGPGTGKTQVLAFRIANILKKTDIKADGILCLTFTNSAVEAMTKRLVQYLGETGEKVNVSTFHSFGMQIIEKYFSVLGIDHAPKLLEDTDVVSFFDEILEENEWKYLRPRGDSTRYYKDLRSLLSLLTRERISREDFLAEVEKEIQILKESEDSRSTRGASKGELKKEIISKIDGLERTKEVAHFINLYEARKKERNVLDYDDVLLNLVKIVEDSEDAAADIREKYLYVLVDEHQDSSRVQNEFISKVWSKEENPDIFVVGDDRQLIYGFSGASIDHFAGFKKVFPNAKLITLVDNYRSTQIILDASHTLLQSVMSDKKLVSQRKENHPIRLMEAENPEAEILACAIDIKEKIKMGVNPNECAILVPKNAQARNALKILYETGLPVSSLQALDLFDQAETQAILRVLEIIATGDVTALALSFFDKSSGIAPIEAHLFFTQHKMREFSLASFLEEGTASLFKETSNIESWKIKLKKWLKDEKNADLSVLIAAVGSELWNQNYIETGPVSPQEITNTLLTLLSKELEKNPALTLAGFVHLLRRLESYNEPVPVIMSEKEGVKVLTMHSSKGLEFDYVWIAHMDEWSLAGLKRGGFTLPETISKRVEERDTDAIKRKLYVAITRAKRFCTLSYAHYSGRENPQELSHIINDLPPEVFKKQKAEKITGKIKEAKKDYTALQKLVREKYGERYISASLLNNFFECPWKWYFQNLLQLPSAPSENLEFGIAMHAAIDQVLKIPTIKDDKEIQKIVRGAVRDGRWQGGAGMRAEKEILNILKRWVKNRLPEIKSSRRIEEGIQAPLKNFSHLKIFGKIDLIENLGGKEVRVTDFKTGSARRKSEIEKLDDEGRMSGNLRQLSMYSYLLRINPKWQAEVKESRLEFLEAKNVKEAFYNTTITNEQIDLLLKDIEDYDRLVKKGDWLKRSCNYNSFGKVTICEYCQIAKVYTEK